MKILKIFTVIFLVLALTTSGLAHLDWLKVDNTLTPLLAWDNGKKTKTITDGESATFSTGRFISLTDSTVSLKAYLNDALTGKTINQIYSEAVDVTKDAQERKITIKQSNYLKPGKYVVVINLQTKNEQSSDVSLTLEVKEKSNSVTPVNPIDPNGPKVNPGPFKKVIKPYAFMSWSGQDINQKSKTVIVGESAKAVYVASSNEGYVIAKLELVQNGKVIKKLVEKSATDNYLAYVTGSETLNLGVGKYELRLVAVDKDKDYSVYSLYLDVNQKTATYKPKIPQKQPGPFKKVPQGKAAPSITLSSNNVVVKENEKTSITVTATDADSKNLKLRAYFKYTIFGWTLPIEFKSLWGATFVDNGDNTGTYTFAPDYNFVIHKLTSKVTDLYVAASDGETTDAEAKVTVTVLDVNRKPTFVNFVKDRTIEVGKELKFKVTGTDADKEDIKSLKFAAGPASLGFKFTEKGEFTWTPTKTGEYAVFFQITDQMGLSSDLATLKINVKAAPVKPNTPPVMDPIKDKTGYVGEKVSFGVKATDADNDKLTFNKFYLPTGSKFTDNGDGTGTFTWTPTKVGTYKMAFQADDGKAESKAEFVTLTIKEKSTTNNNPVIESIGDKQVEVGKQLTIKVKATDKDGDKLTWEVNPKDFTGHKFVDNGDGTGVFTWTPTKVGTYSALFGVSDGMGGEDKENIGIEVNAKPVTPTNNNPVIESIGDKQVEVGKQLTIKVKATDKDGDKLTWEVNPKDFTGHKFVDNGDGTGVFTWTPTKVGTYSALFGVSDGFGGGEAKETIKINVIRSNSAPKIVSSPLTTANLGKEYTYTVKVVDAENDPVKYEVLSGPAGMSFKNNVLSWTPTNSGKACALIQVTETNTASKLTDSQGFCVGTQEKTAEVKFVTANLWSEYLLPGEYLRINVGVNNNGDKDFEDLKVTGVVYSLGLMRTTGHFDLDSGKTWQKQLVMEIPADTPVGDYYVRITVSGDEIKHTTHRVFTIY